MSAMKGLLNCTQNNLYEGKPALHHRLKSCLWITLQYSLWQVSAITSKEMHRADAN